MSHLRLIVNNTNKTEDQVDFFESRDSYIQRMLERSRNRERQYQKEQFKQALIVFISTVLGIITGSVFMYLIYKIGS